MGDESKIDAIHAFPSLLVRRGGIEALGSFARLQAQYLEPDREDVEALTKALREHDIGVVAHFYMDAELQGVLAASSHPHIYVSDSLVMADRALAMAESGARAIVVLGVDFMSENVRALLDAKGYGHVPVYRATAEDIGCSLAEAADTRGYIDYLREGAKSPNPLHVVYINTSLGLKAQAQSLIPTITCTSSNVFQTLLQAAAQVPDLNLYFGPDSYMGANLAHMLASTAKLGAAEIARLHPAHTPASIASLAKRFRYFEDGQCIVHHMFGADIVTRVKAHYQDALLTAHLEVPGEMFALAAEAAKTDRGVVGSTSQILAFIQRKVEAAASTSEPPSSPGESKLHPKPLRFVLGTESGMVTSIVRTLRQTLENTRRNDLCVEIIFPTADEAFTPSETTPSDGASETLLPLVPGPAAGEGCSPAGGCATCPYMKQNSLAALLTICERISQGDPTLKDHFARPPVASQIPLETAQLSRLGTLPILAMRHFQQEGTLPDELIAQMRAV